MFQHITAADMRARVVCPFICGGVCANNARRAALLCTYNRWRRSRGVVDAMSAGVQTCRRVYIKHEATKVPCGKSKRSNNSLLIYAMPVRLTSMAAKHNATTIIIPTSAVHTLLTLCVRNNITCEQSCATRERFATTQ